MNRFNRFYGWYMVRYTNGKSTPLVTNIVDAISVGSFLTPFLLLQEGVWFKAFLGVLTVIGTVTVASLFVALIGHVKIRFGTLHAEFYYNDMQRPLIRETWENSKAIREKLNKDWHYYRTHREMFDP